MRITRRAKRTARRLFRLCASDRTLQDERVRLVSRRLAASTQRNRLAVLTHFRRLVRLRRDRHRAVVESAVPLDDELRAAVVAALTRLHGDGLQPSFEVNAGLIGGMRIKVGSDVYDGSVRGRLAAIEARLS